MINYADYVDADELAAIQDRQKKHALELAERTIPERFKDDSFSTFRVKERGDEKALKTAKDFCADINAKKTTALIISGDVGTGKTHLACAILKEVGGRYVLSAKIESDFNASKAFGAEETFDAVVKKYSGVPLLVIDEVGRESNAKDAQFSLYQIVNERYNRHLPTVLIANFERAELVRYVGIATIDRLTEGLRTITLTGRSKRGM